MQPKEALFSLTANRSVRIRSAGSNHTTSDAGVFVMREVIEKTGLLDDLADRLQDPRTPHRIQHPLLQLLLQSLLQLCQGWRALWNEPLRTDAAFGAATSIERGDQVVGPARTLASQSTMSRFLQQVSTKGNLSHLKASILKLAMEHMRTRNGGRRRDEVVIDVDAVPVDAHGKQLGSAYHGYYGRTVFLPLIASCGETGDVLGAELRPGNQHEVTDCEDFVVSVASAVRTHAADRVVVRLDAGFNSGAVCARLEAEGIGYVMRLRKNPTLETLADEHLAGRTFETTECIELEYGADSWGCTRRVILVVKPRPGEIFVDYYFLVTNLDVATRSGAELVALYRRRGKAEMHQGEIKAACDLSLSSSPRPKSHYRKVAIEHTEDAEADDDARVGAENAARLQLYMLAYELLHISRCLHHSPAPPVEVTDEAPAVQRDGDLPDAALSQAESPDESAEAVPERETDQTQEPTPAASPPPHLHIRTFRLQVLKVGATLARHSRYATFYIAQSAVKAWKRLWKHLEPLRWHTLPDF